MSKASLKQTVLNSIEKLPKDASLEDIILNIYIAHNDGNEKAERITPDDLQKLIREIGIN